MVYELRKSPSGPPVFDGTYLPGGTVRADDNGQLDAVGGSSPGQLWYWDGTLWLPTSSAPEDGQSPVWSASENEYLFETPPSLGDLEYFDNTHSPVACYRFDNTLSDSSGNGFNLAATTTFSYSPIYPGKTGVFIPTGGALLYAPLGSALAITGDVTLEIILQFDGSPASFMSLLGYTGIGETQAANELYNLGLPITGNPPRRLQWFSESGAGVNATFTSTGDTGLGFIHNVMYVAARRASNVVTFFLNGLPMGASSGTLTTPDGGSSSQFRVGGNASGGATDHLIAFSAKVVSGALSNADILAEYNRTMGPAFGRL